MIEVFQDRNFFTYLFNEKLIGWLTKSIMLLLHQTDLLRRDIEVWDGELFHSVLIVTLLHKIDWAIRSFSDKLDHLESSDELFGVILDKEEISHFLKVNLYLV